MNWTKLFALIISLQIASHLDAVRADGNFWLALLLSAVMSGCAVVIVDERMKK